jgi:hypothetical protein
MRGLALGAGAREEELFDSESEQAQIRISHLYSCQESQNHRREPITLDYARIAHRV